MHHEFQHLLQEATRLTRQGDLTAATRTIQRALGADGHASFSDSDVIDVETRVVPERENHALSVPVGQWAPARQPSPAPEPATLRRAPPELGTGVFTSGRHGGAGLAGRDYKLFVPPGAGSRPMPLVVMLHGCTQDPDDFAAGTRMNELARTEGIFVLYPAQSQRANPQRCWNWFKHNHQARGRGEPELIARMTREVMAQHAIDADRVYVAGLSAGAAMAALVGAAYPELFAAVGVHSGLAPGAARDVRSAFEAMKKGAAQEPGGLPVPTIVFHGDADPTVHPANGAQVAAAATPAGGVRSAPETLRANGRHAATRHVHREAAGAVVMEHWSIHGLKHAWSGGCAQASYTDPKGPDASAEMLRFFLEHPRSGHSG